MSDVTTRRASPGVATLIAALLVAGVLAAGATLAACGGSNGGAPGDGPQPGAPALAADGAVDGADITGRVTSAAALVGDGGDTAGLAFLVEDGRGAYDKASVTTTAATGWYRVVGDALEEVGAPPTATALAGATVAVAFTGPVAESYPVQATGGWVVLLP